MKNYLLVLIGAGANLLLGFNEALSKPDYRFLIFFKQNIIPTICNIILGEILVFASDNITWQEALLYGSAGQYYWKKLANMTNPNYPTAIGIN
jgi:hypothetical protein